MASLPQTRIQTIGRLLSVLVQEAFRILLVGYIILLVLDQLIPDFASSQMSLGVWLGALIITGLITLLADQTEPVTTPAASPRSVRGSRMVMAGVGFIGAYLVYSRLGDIGPWRLVMALVTGGLIYLIGSQLLFDNPSQQ